MTQVPELALVVGAARSGTTLTRLLLDAHPEIGCPSEAGLPALMDHLVQVWSAINADELSGEGPIDPGAAHKDGDAPPRWDDTDHASGADDRIATDVNGDWDLPKRARDWVVGAVQPPMIDYCQRRGKRVYCDKSLDSVYHLGLVRKLFPDTRVVLVFRHVMDTVASGIEASPWGFSAYGYTPYVQSMPGNSVAALASYWLDHVTRALQFEHEHPGRCHRVRYEDLVLRPDEAVAEVQAFLGVREDMAVLENAFSRQPPRGPGDYKIEHTSAVHASSIGHGKRVPVALLPPPLLTALNEKLAELGYPQLDLGWNASERPGEHGGGGGVWADRLADLMSAMRLAEPIDMGAFAIIAEDHPALRWVVEPERGLLKRGDGEVEAVLTGTAEDLVLMLTGEENLGVQLRSGRIRHVVAEEEASSRRDLVREMNGLVALLRGGLRDSDGSVYKVAG